VSHDETIAEVEPPDYKYFAPEMTLNSKVEEVPEEASVFALGCIICELLLGKPLISAKNKLDYMYIVCGLYPKQKLDGQQQSSLLGSEASEPTKTFDSVM
jgi:serine/threonine protein kinase